ncbi:MAG: hypothetical protein JWR75_1967 [Devosia sp.]|nr:hypothetical protein [Devosia sp.]
MVEFLQFFSSLAWPVTVVVLAMIFRSDLSAAMQRVRKAGIAGVELAEQQTVVAAVSQFEKSGELKQLPIGFRRTPPIADLEMELHNSISVFVKEDRIDILISELAFTRMTRHFEAAWGIIFESQIRALQVAVSTEGKVDEINIRSLYESSDYPVEFSFEDWVKFPVGQLFATRGGQTFEITDLGREFLNWLPTKGALRRPA